MQGNILYNAAQADMLQVLIECSVMLMQDTSFFMSPPSGRMVS